MTGIFVEWTPGRRNSPGWVEDGTGCHIWYGCRNGLGYAQVQHDGRRQLVYRVRYELEIGPIPEGTVMDHYVCGNGPGGCCNPRHVRPVAQRENVLRADSIPARRAAKTHCVKGHPLAGDNLIPGKLKIGKRECRACDAERQRIYGRRQRAAAKDRLA